MKVHIRVKRFQFEQFGTIGVFWIKNDCNHIPDCRIATQLSGELLIAKNVLASSSLSFDKDSKLYTNSTSVRSC